MMGFHPASFDLPRPFRSRVRPRHATDRQTDGRTFYNVPFLRGTGITKQLQFTGT